MKKLLAAVCALVLMIATAHAQPPPGPRFGPPAPPFERVPPPPRAHPSWVWRGGFYRWSGSRYVWVPGDYLQPPRPGNRWQPGRWTQAPHGWIWVNGRWF